MFLKGSMLFSIKENASLYFDQYNMETFYFIMIDDNLVIL